MIPTLWIQKHFTRGSVHCSFLRSTFLNHLGLWINVCMRPKVGGCLYFRKKHVRWIREQRRPPSSVPVSAKKTSPPLKEYVATSPAPLHTNVGQIQVESAPACEKNFASCVCSPAACPTLKLGVTGGGHETRLCVRPQRSYFCRHRSRR